MTSGKPLTEEQKEKIRKEIKFKTKCQLAKEMGLHYRTISKFVKKEHLENDDSEKPYIEPDSED